MTLLGRALLSGCLLAGLCLPAAAVAPESDWRAQRREWRVERERQRRELRRWREDQRRSRHELRREMRRQNWRGDRPRLHRHYVF